MIGGPTACARPPRGGPCLGADTDTLLSEVLGYDAARIKEELRDGGVLLGEMTKMI